MNHFLEIWNAKMSHYPLSLENMNDPAVVMGGLIEVIKGIGINVDNMLTGNNDTYQDHHVEYYADLLSVINVARVANYILLNISSPYSINLSEILAPSSNTASTMAVLLNYFLFVEHYLDQFRKSMDGIKVQKSEYDTLVEEKYALTNELNAAQAEKATRPTRIKKLKEEEQVLTAQMKELKEEELQLEMRMKNMCREQSERETVKEQLILQAKALEGQLEFLRTQLVSDADDVRFKEKQSNMREAQAIEKVQSLQESLEGKERMTNTLKGMTSIIGEANRFLQEIIDNEVKLNSLKNQDCDCSEIDEMIAKKEKSVAELEKTVKELEEVEQKYELENLVATEKKYAELLAEIEAAEQLHNSALKEKEEKELEMAALEALTLKYEEKKVKLLENSQNMSLTFKKEMNGIQESVVAGLLNIVSRMKAMRESKGHH